MGNEEGNETVCEICGGSDEEIGLHSLEEEICIEVERILKLEICDI